MFYGCFNWKLRSEFETQSSCRSINLSLIWLQKRIGDMLMVLMHVSNLRNSLANFKVFLINRTSTLKDENEEKFLNFLDRNIKNNNERYELDVHCKPALKMYKLSHILVYPPGFSLLRGWGIFCSSRLPP